MAEDFLHDDDHAHALAILRALLDGRDPLPCGWLPDAGGAWVDWEQLAHSWLSTTEKAVVHIARGIALAEVRGGLPPRERDVVYVGIVHITS